LSYRDFTLSDVVERFSLTTSETSDLFAVLPPIQPSALLVETLKTNVPIAVAVSRLVAFTRTSGRRTGRRRPWRSRGR